MSSDKELNKSIDMDRFRKLCYKFTDQEISDAAAIERSLVTKHRNNTRNISIADLIKYANAFNVSVEYLLGTDTDEITPEEFKQKVCEYTGLNETTVDCIKNSKDIQKCLNLLFEVDPEYTQAFFEFLYSLVNAKCDGVKKEDYKKALYNEAVYKYMFDNTLQKILNECVISILKKDTNSREK